jgi:general secretion pathway protein A
MLAMDENPFTTAVDPLNLYLTPSLDMTLDKVRYVVDSRQGLTVIYGEVGHGKSTVLRYLYEEYDTREDCQAVLLPNPDYETELAMLKGICTEFGVGRKRSKLDQQAELRAYLFDLYAQNRNCVVFVDEAQLLKGRVLELVRSLLNFETNRHKLMQIVLCGQLELRDRLRDPSKKALRSRIILTSTLDPLSLQETEAMIRFRCDRARIPVPFAPDVIEAVFLQSRGVPREVLKICGTAYHLAMKNRITEIPLEVVESVTPHVEVV